MLPSKLVQVYNEAEDLGRKSPFACCLYTFGYVHIKIRILQSCTVLDVMLAVALLQGCFNLLGGL